MSNYKSIIYKTKEFKEIVWTKRVHKIIINIELNDQMLNTITCYWYNTYD